MYMSKHWYVCDFDVKLFHSLLQVQELIIQKESNLLDNFFDVSGQKFKLTFSNIIYKYSYILTLIKDNILFI